jgi:hypothetical protein
MVFKSDMEKSILSLLIGDLMQRFSLELLQRVIYWKAIAGEGEHCVNLACYCASPLGCFFHGIKSTGHKITG